MQLIEEIIEILTSEQGKLSDALIKTKVLLHRIGHKELVPWVNNELNGYPDLQSVPEYRLLPAQVLINGASVIAQVTAHPIPLGHLTKEQREAVEIARMGQSLAVLERFAEKDSGHLESHIAMETYGLLGQGLDKSFQIHKAWSNISPTSVMQILIQVRSRLLDFLLDLQGKLPPELDETEVKDRISGLDAENMFNNAIFGDNVTILVGNRNTQTVAIDNSAGSIEELAETLKKAGVSEPDVSSLREAIEADSELVDTEKREYGPAVKLWLTDMLSKAVDAAWNVELGVASSLLATALNNYYGWF